MPIAKQNKPLYPEEWPELRAGILERSGNRCEVCGILNYSIVDKKSRRMIDFGEMRQNGIEPRAKWTREHTYLLQRLHWTRIVLTIAHLDHDPTHNDPENLKAMCQKCHNNYDRAHRDETIAAAKHKAMSQNYAGWQLRLPLPIKEEENAPEE